MKTRAVVFAVVVSLLAPVLALAQRRHDPGRYRPPYSAPDARYYNDESVRESAKRYTRVHNIGYEVVTNGRPQVPGGLYDTPPQADEEDVLNDHDREVETLDADLTLYAGVLGLYDKDGKRIVIRRKKVGHKLVAVVNCGNWTRDVGQPTERIEVPGPKEIHFLPCQVHTNELISDETHGDVRRIEHFDGCVRTIDTIVTKFTVTCELGHWNIAAEYGQRSQGKLGKNFRLSDQGVVSSEQSWILQLIAAAHEEYKQGKRDGLLEQDLTTDKKIKYFLLLQGACESERNRFKLVWFSDSWHWKEFVIGLAVGIAIGFLIPHGPGVPMKSAGPPGGVKLPPEVITPASKAGSVVTTTATSTATKAAGSMLPKVIGGVAAAGGVTGAVRKKAPWEP